MPKYPDNFLKSLQILDLIHFYGKISYYLDFCVTTHNSYQLILVFSYFFKEDG